MIAASIPALAIFGWFESKKHKRDQSALIVPSLFKTRSFVSGLTLNVILESVMIGYFLTITLVLQAGLGIDVLKAAVIGVPTAVGMAFSFAVLSNKLIPKFGRNVISIGATLFAAGLLYTTWVITHYTLNVGGWQFIPGLFVAGMGLALIMAPIFSAALQDVDPSHAGSASGVLNAIQQVGAAIGVAVIGMIFFGQLNHGAYKSFDDISPQLRKELTTLHIPAQAQDQIIAQTRTCYYDRTTAKDNTVTPESCKQAEAGAGNSEAAKKIGAVVTQNVKQANADNFAHAFKMGVVYTLSMLIIAVIVSQTLPKKFRVVEEGAL
jgi:hypothetical protein